MLWGLGGQAGGEGGFGRLLLFGYLANRVADCSSRLVTPHLPEVGQEDVDRRRDDRRPRCGMRAEIRAEEIRQTHAVRVEKVLVDRLI